MEEEKQQMDGGWQSGGLLGERFRGGAEGGNGEVEEEGDGGQVKRMQGEVVQRETRRGDKGRTESEAGR